MDRDSMIMAASHVRQWAWRVHKVLAYVVFIQVFLWVAGGLLFATLPFKAWVKGGDYVTPPAEVALPAGWQTAVARLPVPVHGIQSFASAQGVLLAVTTADDQWLFTAAGDAAGHASPAEVEQFGRSLLVKSPETVSVRWVSEPEYRLGIVDELAGAAGLWQLSVDDAYRLYFSPEGRFLKVRTNAWVWFDALWRLHIMDYGKGEDFNNSLLRVFSWLAMAFVLSGTVLVVFAARQQWRRQMAKRRPAHGSE